MDGQLALLGSTRTVPCTAIGAGRSVPVAPAIPPKFPGNRRGRAVQSSGDLSYGLAAGEPSGNLLPLPQSEDSRIPMPLRRGNPAPFPKHPVHGPSSTSQRTGNVAARLPVLPPLPQVRLLGERGCSSGPNHAPPCLCDGHPATWCCTDQLNPPAQGATNPLTSALPPSRAAPSTAPPSRAPPTTSPASTAPIPRTTFSPRSTPSVTGISSATPAARSTATRFPVGIPRIRVRPPRHARKPHRRLLPRVVHDDLVALAHGAEARLGLRVGNTVPAGVPIAQEVLERVRRGFGLDEPEGHAVV